MRKESQSSAHVYLPLSPNPSNSSFFFSLFYHIQYLGRYIFWLPHLFIPHLWTGQRMETAKFKLNGESWIYGRQSTCVQTTGATGMRTKRRMEEWRLMETAGWEPWRPERWPTCERKRKLKIEDQRRIVGG